MANNKNNLGNTGIEVIEQLEDEKVIDVVNQVAIRIMTAFPNHNLSYLDLYRTLLDTPMYYAKIPKGLSKANYYHKDSSIYFSESANLSNVDEFVFHEFIHRLQERKDKKGNITRLGVCEVNELSVKATALNEAAIQFVTTKAFDMPKKQVTIYDIKIPSKTEYYPIITNIISQLAFLLGENILIDSTLNGNEEFKISIIDNIGESEYNFIEKNSNEILRLKNEILDIQNNMQLAEKWQGPENPKALEIEEKSKTINNIFFEIQNKIYTAYFNNILKRAENDFEVKMILQKLEDYREYIGTAENNIAFNLFYSNFTQIAEHKIEELNNTTALVILKDNIIYRIFRKIKRLFFNSKNEYNK